MSKNYLAPFVNHKINAEITVPSSKSLTNRILILSALTELSGNPRPILENALISRDSQLMESAIELILSRKENETVPIDVGLAGTVMRFVPPLAALSKGETIFDGDEGAKKRPMGPILDGLEKLGVEIRRQNGDFLPFSILGTGEVEGGEIEIDASSSSQFVSGLLLCAPLFKKGILVRNSGNKLPSLPHIEMTLSVLRNAGVNAISLSENSWKVESGQVFQKNEKIETDLSNAGPFLCAALANPFGGEVSVKDWPSKTTQPGDKFREVLKMFGAKVELENEVLQVKSDGEINAIDIDLSDAGEIAPTVCALAALAKGESVIRGIGHLRGHETDRLEALVSECVKIGRNAKIGADGESILIAAMKPGDTLKNATIETYSDHRMATFAAILGLRIPGIEIVNVETTAKTMPDFVKLWEGMLKQ